MGFYNCRITEKLILDPKVDQVQQGFCSRRKYAYQGVGLPSARSKSYWTTEILLGTKSSMFTGVGPLGPICPIRILLSMRMRETPSQPEPKGKKICYPSFPGRRKHALRIAASQIRVSYWPSGVQSQLEAGRDRPEK
jgi:hypothetical protein